jgi:hypothetical protein
VPPKATTAKGPDESALAEALLKAPSDEPMPQTGKQGIFPTTKPGKTLLQQALALGYVEECEAPPPPPSKGKKAPARSRKTVPHARVTAKGREWALQKTSPKNALELLVSTLQGVASSGGGVSQEAMSELQAQLGDIQASLSRVSQLTQEAVTRHRQETNRLSETVREAMSVARRLTVDMPPPPPTMAQATTTVQIDPEILAFVRTWQQQRGAGCPLPDLYAHLKSRFPELTIGKFHDRLRALHDKHEVRLSGMSGSLDTLREPETALLVSSKVMYYVNIPDRLA